MTKVSELVEHGSELRARILQLDFQETGDKKRISGEVFECLMISLTLVSQFRVHIPFFNERPQKKPKEQTRIRRLEITPSPFLTVSHVCSTDKSETNKIRVQVRPRRFACWVVSLWFGQGAPLSVWRSCLTAFRKYRQKHRINSRGYHPHPSRVRVQIPFNPPDPRLTWFSFEQRWGGALIAAESPRHHDGAIFHDDGSEHDDGRAA